MATLPLKSSHKEQPSVIRLLRAKRLSANAIDIFPKFKMAATAILDFYLMWIWPFWRVDSVVFVFCAKFGSNICYSHIDRRTYVSDVHLMTSRELTSGFDFWSRDHFRMAVLRLPINVGADIFIRSGVIDIFPKFKMAAATILDFHLMWIWPFRRVDSVVFVFCTKFSYSHWDRCTYASEVHMMTSRELTSGFDFWSRGRLRIVVIHLPINLVHIFFIQSGVIGIFWKLKMAAAAILDLLKSHGTTHEGSFVVRTPCKNFVMTG